MAYVVLAMYSSITNLHTIVKLDHEFLHGLVNPESNN